VTTKVNKSDNKSEQGLGGLREGWGVKKWEKMEKVEKK